MTKVLIDSSSWIHFFNHHSSAQHAMVKDMIQEDRAVIGGPIITEVLRGARNARERRLIERHLQLLTYFPLEREDYEKAAKLGFDLARKGFTIKTMDLIIATLALKNKIAIVHDDRDFEMIAKHTPLKTFRPS